MIVWNVLFLAGFITVTAGFYRMKKSDVPLGGVLWLFISCICALCFHALAGALFHRISIPISVLSVGIADLACGSFLLYSHRHGYQKYKWFCKVFWHNKELISGIEANEEKTAPSAERQKLYELSADKCRTENCSVFPVGRSGDRYFINALTGQWNVAYLHIDSPEDYVALLEEWQPDYICVMKKSSAYRKNKKYLRQFPKLYENEEGFFARYKKVERE